MLRGFFSDRLWQLSNVIEYSCKNAFNGIIITDQKKEAVAASNHPWDGSGLALVMAIDMYSLYFKVRAFCYIIHNAHAHVHAVSHVDNQLVVVKNHV